MLGLHAIVGAAALVLSQATQPSWARPPGPSTHTPLTFDLAQEFWIQSDDSEALGLKLTSTKASDGTPSVSLKSVPTTVYRPRSFDAVENARKRSLYGQECEPVEWVQTEASAPDITDRYTLAQLGRMTANAYKLPTDKKWYPLDPYWNVNSSFPFGWEDDQDGFRGHVFRSRDESTIVLSIKGTTIQGATSDKDKLNDNLLFSCCCARVDFTWAFSTVCDCFSWSPLHSRCDDTCLTKALVQDSLFYSVGVDLIKDILFLYPTSDVWLVGHSLGGALASLLGSTFGLPAVAFEAPGERLAAKRLHLPLPPSLGDSALPHVPVTHVYHNADPIPQGTCSGVASICAQAGYALETRCHLGKSIIYDTVGRLGWHADVTKHPIKEVVFKVLEDEGPWPDGDNGEVEVPTARAEEDCIDCYKWEFGDFKKDKDLENQP